MIVEHRKDVTSRGQKMPVASMCGSVAPMQSLMASMEVLQMVDRNTPKHIPAKPGRGERMIGTFFFHGDHSVHGRMGRRLPDGGLLRYRK